MMSDHGSCAIERFIMIHTVLADAGLVAFKPGIADEQVRALCDGADLGTEEAVRQGSARGEEERAATCC